MSTESESPRTRGMIALFPASTVAAELAIEASDEVAGAGVQLEQPEDLHVTVAHFRDIPADKVDMLLKAAAMLSCCYEPISVDVEGIGQFAVEEDGAVPVVLLLDPSALFHMHSMALDCTGGLASTNHGYIPHITLAYAPQGVSLSLDAIPVRTLSFAGLSLLIGEERHDFPFTGGAAAEEMVQMEMAVRRLQGELASDPPIMDGSDQPPVVSQPTGESMKATVVLDGDAESASKEVDEVGEAEKVGVLQVGMRQKLATAIGHLKDLMSWADKADQPDETADAEDKPDEDDDPEDEKEPKMAMGKMEVTPTPEPGQLLVFKDANGDDRWISLSTTAFKDKDEEIIPTALLERAVERGDRQSNPSDRGPLRIWHTPGTEIGDCDFQSVEGRFLLESGTFRNNEMAARARAWAAVTKEEVGVSIGFLYPKDLFDGTTYGGEILIHERSILPRSRAAHGWTSFSDLGGAMNPAKKSFLASIIGEDLTENLISKAQNQTKELEAAGVAFKSADGKVLSLSETVAAMGEALGDNPNVAVKAAYDAFASAVKEAETPPDPKKEAENAVAEVVKAAIAPVVEASTKNSADIAGLVTAVKALTDHVTTLGEAAKAAAALEAQKVDDTPRGATVFRASADKATEVTVDAQVTEIIQRAEALTRRSKEDSSSDLPPNAHAAEPYVRDIMGLRGS